MAVDYSAGIISDCFRALRKHWYSVQRRYVASGLECFIRSHQNGSSRGLDQRAGGIWWDRAAERAPSRVQSPSRQESIVGRKRKQIQRDRGCCCVKPGIGGHNSETSSDNCISKEVDNTTSKAEGSNSSKEKFNLTLLWTQYIDQQWLFCSPPVSSLNAARTNISKLATTSLSSHRTTPATAKSYRALRDSLYVRPLTCQAPFSQSGTTRASWRDWATAERQC